MRVAGLQRQAIGLGFLASVLVFSAPAGAITIDAFTTAQTVSATRIPLNDPAAGFVSGGGVLGSERDVQADIIGLTGTMSVSVLAGSLTITTGAGNAGIANLWWDGADAAVAPSFSPGLNQDLTAGGDSAFEISITSNTGDTPILRLIVMTTSGDFSTYSEVLTGAPQTLLIPYASFTPTGAGANFASVDVIQLQVDGTGINGLSVTTGALMTVPEPSSLALLGLGLLGLATQGRRR